MSDPKRIQRKPRLHSLLDAPGSPLFLLDRNRKVQFVNSGLTELVGWSATDLLRQQCHYQSLANENDVQSVLNSLCPPAEIFNGIQQSVPVYIPQKDRQPAAKLIHFYPLCDQTGTVEHVLGIITSVDVPDKKAVGSPAQQLHAELAALRLNIRNRYGLDKIIVNTSVMQRVLMQIQLAIKTHSTVFLAGEPGVGKEHLARLIHQEGQTAQRAFIPLNCKLLPTTELKSTLRRALQTDPDAADPPTALQPGTIYLKHVADMPRDTQEWLVENWSHAPHLRLISSDATDLESTCSTERVREDFCYLLTTLTIAIPPLRERREELRQLAQHFLELGNQLNQQQITGFAEDTWNIMHEYNWPGNLDELAEVIEEARSATQDHFIQPHDLPFRFRTGLQNQQESPAQKIELQKLDQRLKAVESEHIELALEISQQNKALAAELLGITRAKLYRRMEQLHISTDSMNDS